MREVQEYDLLKADDHENILEKINRACNNGWEAQGGIAVNGKEDVGGNYRFYQLMVMYKKVVEPVEPPKAKTIVK